MFVFHFLLLLVPLVFFHELGHFLVARWMGVRVLSFSIGFGPVVFEWESGGTQYAVRALPLGGFVRMLGEDAPGEDNESSGGPPEPDSFAAKAVWRRALIVAAGPIANFILPMVILLVGSLMMDGQVISSRIGTVLPGGPAERAGLVTGDKIVEVDGEEVRHFRDLQRVIAARPDQKVTALIERNGKKIRLSLTPEAKVDARLPEIGIVDRVGRIQVLPDTQSAIVAVSPDSAAWAAGLRSGDRIVSIGGAKTPGYWQAAEALAQARGTTVSLTVQNLKRGKKPDAPMHDKDHPKTLTLAVPAGDADVGVHPAQAVVGRVEPDTPAAKAGLLVGDELTAINGKEIGSFFALVDVIRKPYDKARGAEENLGLEGEELLTRLNAALSEPFAVTYRRLEAGSVVTKTASLRMDVAIDKRTKRPRLQLGLGPAQRYEAPERIANPAPIPYAWERMHTEMGEAIKVTGLTVVGLFRGRVPMKEVGGPIFMAQLASKTADLGWGYFFRLMVWLSINLAILNLLPIPLVDGGHLLFLAIEAVKREPVTLRTRMIASYVGMGFIFFVFVMVMKNDVERLIESFVQ
ncbi:MAG: site-2 protease family protein [Myxococcales bacterium]|nr:site-2 protease family protein [Myxococcales bacterium]